MKTFKFLLCFLFLFSSVVLSQQKVKFNSNIFGSVEARHIGPASMSGRITSIDAVNKEPRIIFVGSAGGGVWKSINGGASFKSVFDKYNQSIGWLVIDQKHPDTIWVGTGESNMRNSVSVGDGIYRSVDGGDNWKKCGLEKSEHISKIIIDPENSNTIYAAVPGALWSDSKERGLYKSTDLGNTWENILYVNEKTGCADIELDPQNPNILYASMWQFRRTPWSFSSGGDGSGLFKSEDYGKTWKKIDKDFAADGILGRICIAVAPTEPKNIYAMVESKKNAFYSSNDFGETWKKESATENATARPFYFSVLEVDPTDSKRIYRPAFNLSISIDGGKSFTEPGFEAGWVHVDHHAIWINPGNPSHLLLGTDGGVYLSMDRGFNWRFLNNLPVSQFYHISFDNEIPYNVMGGLQDNGSWLGPSRSNSGIKNGDWLNLGGGDGFWVFRDKFNNNVFYTEYQGGEIYRYDIKANESKSIKPYPLAGEEKLRFNWNTPIHLSRLDNKVMYIGAQFLFRSTNMGETWHKISPDLTTNDPEKQKQEESGGLSVDNSSAENHCTIFAISESPRNKKIIWVGTDDGNIQVTKDYGKSWTNVISSITGLPKNTWCSSIESSLYDENTAFVTFDGHATGDLKTYIYKTTDLGKTWQSLNKEGSNLNGYAHKIKQDLVNKNLIFAGTEFGLFISIDGGENWAQYTSRVPNTAIRDIEIHPVTNDLLLATHGRGILIIDDITSIRSLTNDMLEMDAAILSVRNNFLGSISYGSAFPMAGEFIGQNPVEEAVIAYYLKERVMTGDLNIEILNKDGKVIAKIPASKRKGINKVTWNMRMKPPKVASAVRITMGGFVGPNVPEGDYTIRLTKGDNVLTQNFRIEGDPKSPHNKNDRALQYKTTMRLYGMQEELAFIVEMLNRLKKDLKSASDSLTANAMINDFRAKIDSLTKTLAASKEGTGIIGEEKLREKLSALYSGVAYYSGRPSESQLQRVEALQIELNDANSKQNLLCKEFIEQINDVLEKAGLKKISLYSREQFALDLEKEKGL